MAGDGGSSDDTVAGPVNLAGIPPDALDQLYGTHDLNLDFLQGKFSDYGFTLEHRDIKYQTEEKVDPTHGTWNPSSHITSGRVPPPNMDKAPFKGVQADFTGMPPGRPGEAVSPAPLMEWEQLVGLFRGKSAPPDHQGGWNTEATALDGENGNFTGWLNYAEDAANHPEALPAASTDDKNWSGDTGTAITGSARNFENMVPGLSSSFKTQGQLAKAFADTIKPPLDYIDKYAPVYDAFKKYYNSFLPGGEHYGDGSNTQNATNNLKKLQDEFKKSSDAIINNFNQNMGGIAAHHPDVSKLDAPAPPTNPGGGGGGLGGGAGGGGGTPGGAPPVGMPTAPDFSDLINPNQTPATPKAQSPADALSGLGNAANGAGNAAKSAAGQAANAAQQGLGALGQAMKGTAPPGAVKPPEGVLGLGPKGLSGAGKTGGAGGGRGGGTGRGLTSAKPETAKMATTPTKAAAATPVSRAGVSGQGTPGAGAPAAGHRGAAAAGVVHKANKALRSQRNGRDVVGDTPAAMPVIGDERQEPAPVKPEPA